jgi:hypothetical protein
LRAAVIVLFWTAATLVAAACSGGGAATPTPLPTIAGRAAAPGVAELADRYYLALNSGNVSDMVAILDQDVVQTDGDSQIVGKADVMARLIAGLSAVAQYSYAYSRIEGNSFFAAHTYVVNADRDTGIFPLATVQIELVAQDGKITFINVTSDGEADTPTASAPTPSAAGASTPTPGALGELEDLDAIRRLTFDYWIAFNDYDTEKVLSYLEESYRAEREEEIADDIGRIKLFRVSLGVSQRSPAVLTSPTEGEMMINLKEPLGTRQVRMAFRKVDGEWKITHAEQEE